MAQSKWSREVNGGQDNVRTRRGWCGGAIGGHWGSVVVTHDGENTHGSKTQIAVVVTDAMNYVCPPLSNSAVVMRGTSKAATKHPSPSAVLLPSPSATVHGSGGNHNL